MGRQVGRQVGQKESGMRVLVTGITGRIGANLAAALVAQGHQVRGLVWARDARVEKLQGLGLELIEGTLTVDEDVRRAVDGVDAICHLGGAFQGGGPFTPAEYFEINVRGTFLMLEAARQQEGLHRFVFASTDAQYEKYVPGGMTAPVTEETPRRPRGWYALSKSVGEELCQGYWRTFQLPVVTLRFSLVVGAGEIVDFRQFYLGKQLATLPELAPLWTGEERLLVMRDPQGRAYKKHIADVRDIVHGCLCALEAPGASGEVFQLGGPAPFTWEEVVPYLAERLGMAYVEARVMGTPTYYEYDLTKAREVLGFLPQYDIFRMIDDALAFKEGQAIGVLPTT
jgi:UDP-glucose 4-epimerase